MVSPRLEHVHVVAPGPSGGACTPSTRLGGRDCARKSYGFWHRNSFDLPGALASGIPDAGASGGRYTLALLSRSYDIWWPPREREVARGFPRSLPLRAAELGPDFSPAFNFSSYKPLFEAGSLLTRFGVSRRRRPLAIGVAIDRIGRVCYLGQPGSCAHFPRRQRRSHGVTAVLGRGPSRAKIPILGNV